MSIYYVYILKCLDKKGKETLYTGSTQDLMQRFDQHQKGRGARYTKSKVLELLYFETHISRSDAMKREYEIKNLPVKEKRELIKVFNEQRQKEKENENASI